MSASNRRTVLCDDPYVTWDDAMQFRLTYEGILCSTQQDKMTGQYDRRADHKHDIRKHFHPQLKRLWDITPHLTAGVDTGPVVFSLGSEERPWLRYHRDDLAKKHEMFGWNFVPLVTDHANLLCGVDILFLRPDHPGSLIRSGDIDNRLKTLLDALRLPVANERYDNRAQGPDDQPFYCLLEDDRLITKISVETDQLLDFDQSKDPNQVKLVINVTVRPYEASMDNVQFL